MSVLLALAASLSWGFSDFLGGLNSRRFALLSVLVISQGISLVPIAAVVLARGESPPPAEFVGFGMAASVAGLAGLAAFYRAMAVGQIGVVAPISATGSIIPVVAGVLGGEPVAGWQMAGVALALAGIVLVSRATGRGSSGGTPSTAGIGFALISALGFGVFFVALHQAGSADLWWAVFVQRATGVGILAAAALLIRPRLAVGWSAVPQLGAAGILDVSANALYTASSTLGLSSLAAVIASLYPVVAVLLARVVLQERLSLVQHAGVASALAGVALISVR